MSTWISFPLPVAKHERQTVRSLQTTVDERVVEYKSVENSSTGTACATRVIESRTDQVACLPSDSIKYASTSFRPRTVESLSALAIAVDCRLRIRLCWL